MEIKTKTNYNGHLAERPDSHMSSQHLSVTSANMGDRLRAMAPPSAFTLAPQNPNLGWDPQSYSTPSELLERNNLIILQSDASKIQVFNLKGASAPSRQSFDLSVFLSATVLHFHDLPPALTPRTRR